MVACVSADWWGRDRLVLPVQLSLLETLRCAFSTPFDKTFGLRLRLQRLGHLLRFDQHRLGALPCPHDQRLRLPFDVLQREGRRRDRSFCGADDGHSD